MSPIANPKRYEWEQGLLANLGQKLSLPTKRDLYNDIIRRYHTMNYNQAAFTAWVDTVVDEPWHSKNKPPQHNPK